MARFSVKIIAFMLLFERRIIVFVIKEIASFHQKPDVSNWVPGYSLCPCWDSASSTDAEATDVHYIDQSILFQMVLLSSVRTKDMITKNGNFSLCNSLEMEKHFWLRWHSTFWAFLWGMRCRLSLIIHKISLEKSLISTVY